MPRNSFWPDRQNWKPFWPARIVALIAVIQLLVSFAILGLQIAIVVVGIVGLCNGFTARYVMGFVCWGFFFACWISVFCVTCCNRSSVGCATYVLVKNILAFVFSIVLIDFDRKFIYYPLFDYTYNNLNDYGTSQNTQCLNNFASNDGTFLTLSLSFTKGQLAGGVIMLVTSLIYVAIYIYTYIQALRQNGNMSNTFSVRGPDGRQNPSSHVTPQQKQISNQSPMAFPDMSMNNNPRLPRSNEHFGNVLCERCGAAVSINERF